MKCAVLSATAPDLPSRRACVDCALVSPGRPLRGCLAYRQSGQLRDLLGPRLPVSSRQSRFIALSERLDLNGGPHRHPAVRCILSDSQPNEQPAFSNGARARTFRSPPRSMSGSVRLRAPGQPRRSPCPQRASFPLHTYVLEIHRLKPPSAAQA